MKLSPELEEEAREKGWDKLFIRADSIPDQVNDPEAFDRFLQARVQNRVPYFESKEIWEREVMEHEAVRKMANFEMRERCRLELDEYMDCVAGKFFAFGCRKQAEKVDKCALKQLNSNAWEDAQNRIKEERRQDGTSIVNERFLTRHNRFVGNVPEAPLPPRKPEDEDLKANQREVFVESRSAEEWKREFQRVKKAPSEADRIFDL